MLYDLLKSRQIKGEKGAHKMKKLWRNRRVYGGIGLVVAAAMMITLVVVSINMPLLTVRPNTSPHNVFDVVLFLAFGGWYVFCWRVFWSMFGRSKVLTNNVTCLLFFGLILVSSSLTSQSNAVYTPLVDVVSKAFAYMGDFVTFIVAIDLVIGPCRKGAKFKTEGDWQRRRLGRMTRRPETHYCHRRLRPSRAAYLEQSELAAFLIRQIVKWCKPFNF